VQDASKPRVLSLGVVIEGLKRAACCPQEAEEPLRSFEIDPAITAARAAHAFGDGNS